jgi:hypothetical protein
MNNYRVVIYGDEPPLWAIAHVRRSPPAVTPLVLFDTRAEAEAALDRAMCRRAVIRAKEQTVSSLLLQMTALHAAAVEQLAIADVAIGRSIARLARVRAIYAFRS